MRITLWSSMSVLALVFGFASGVSAQAQPQDKSWEVDLYRDGADLTYVPDGRDDIHVYDHNNHYNDRSYIEVDQPYYGYRGGYDTRYDYGRYERGYDRYDGRGYGQQRYRPARYRVEYHNRYRGW